VTTIRRGQWFPSTVLLPDKRILRRVYVLACEGGEEGGLHVYDRPDNEIYTAPLDWSATTIPPARRQSAGVDLVQADGGLTVLTPGGGCSCGPLGRWAGPVWSHNVTVSV
jgi:hypothetical protein